MTNITENNQEVLNLPVIALRGLVVFPNLSIQFDVGRKKSILAISDAMEHNQKIFLVAQKDLADNDPDRSQMYPMGVVAQIVSFAIAFVIWLPFIRAWDKKNYEQEQLLEQAKA